MQRATWRDWYNVTKPGIVTGNAIHYIAGFLLAAKADFNVAAGLYGLIGTSLIIASACVVNNYIDRDIDVRMKRTKARASVTGRIPLAYGALYAVGLAVAGFGILALAGLWLVFLLGIIAYIGYTVVYTYSKRFTVHSTLIGSIPGAIPAMAGFVAPTNVLSIGAWLVFLLILAWQMPHFYAISAFRRAEYKQANVPVLGVVATPGRVAMHITVWGVLYVVAAVGLVANHVIGLVAGGVLVGLAAYWLATMLRFKIMKYEKWALELFKQSLWLTLLLPLITLLDLILHALHIG